jgi:hypothetical protein
VRKKVSYLFGVKEDSFELVVIQDNKVKRIMQRYENISAFQQGSHSNSWNSNHPTTVFAV